VRFESAQTIQWNLRDTHLLLPVRLTRPPASLGMPLMPEQKSAKRASGMISTAVSVHSHA